MRLIVACLILRSNSSHIVDVDFSTRTQRASQHENAPKMMSRSRREPAARGRPASPRASAARTGLLAAGRRAEERFGQLPQRHAEKANDKDPERDRAERRPAQGVQRPGPVGRLTGLAERDPERDPADDDIHQAAGEEAGRGKEPQRAAVSDPSGRRFGMACACCHGCLAPPTAHAVSLPRKRPGMRDPARVGAAEPRYELWPLASCPRYELEPSAYLSASAGGAQASQPSMRASLRASAPTRSSRTR